MRAVYFSLHITGESEETWLQQSKIGLSLEKLHMIYYSLYLNTFDNDL